MSSSSSDTRWLNLLKAGDHAAAQVLWERYVRLLVSCARQRLGANPRRAADEEDVALSAFFSFCRGVERGRFPLLEDGDDLRSVLLLLVARKEAHQVRDERCAKRGGGKVRALADLPEAGGDGEVLSRLIDSEPTPEQAAELADECRRLLDKLGDTELFDAAGALQPGNNQNLALLLQCRARLDAAAGDWAAAEKDQTECLRRMSRPDVDGGALGMYCDACLVQGILCQERGDAAGAQAAWRRGRLPVFFPDDPAAIRRWWAEAGTSELLPQFVLAGLVGDLDDAEGQHILERMLGTFKGDAALRQALLTVKVEPALLRQMWQSPRGRACARKLALHEVSFPETIRMPVALMVGEVLRQKAFGGEWTPEDDQLVWNLTGTSLDLLGRGKLSKLQLVPLGVTWKLGSTSLFGWSSVAASLPPDFRGPLAYVLGQRCLRLGRPNEARFLFEAASRDAPAEGPLRSLLKTQRQRLDKQ